jgi:hypothetical protein
MKNKINIYLLIVLAIYTILAIISMNYCYFWDVIQQVSNEAQWFYRTDFSSLLIPAGNEFGVSATGYHPPLMGLMTAFLWKVFGYKLWVSHAFTAFWAVLLIYNSWRLISSLLPKKHIGWVFLIVLLEPTILTQFVIASPDFILFTAFVISLRAMLERKPVWLAVGLIFLCGINMRGVFVGLMLFFAHLYFDCQSLNNQKYSLKKFTKTLLPYLPVFFILLAYYIYYFASQGWFFTDSAYSEHYSLPQSIKGVAVHFAAFILRSVESGRIVIWLFAAYFAALIFIKKKITLSKEEKTLALFVLLMNGLYLLFVFITQMPFGARYFMPQFFALSLVVFLVLIRYFNDKKLKIIFPVILVFTLTGHFWIYPEKISQSWDSTLAHISYYEVRKECFEYIDNNNFDYNVFAAGFNLYGNRNRIELTNENKTLGASFENAKYFIYSNISNLEDENVDELKDTTKWTPIKHFEKFPVFITIYQRINENTK